MQRSEQALEKLDFKSADISGDSTRRFADRAQYRIEIPSTEGPVIFREVLEEAKRVGCPVHRVSQGSGIQMLSDEDIREMARIGAGENIEVCLFPTPRANFDVGGLWGAPVGRVIQWQVRGAEQMRYSLDDVFRAVDLGIRSILPADIGLISVLGKLKASGDLPGNLVLKSSAILAPANAATARLLEELGANTINVATDLTVPQLAAIRHSVNVPIDIYVEAPDGLGGFVRHHEVPAMIAHAGPVYLKLGLRNSPDIYPYGKHLEATTLNLSKERVRRSKLVYDLVRREYPEAVISEVGSHADLGIPEV